MVQLTTGSNIQAVFGADNEVPDILDKEIIYNGIHNLPLWKRIDTGYRYKNRLDLVAYDFYKNTELWWAIGLYNKISNPMNFNNKEISLFIESDFLELVSKSKRIQQG